MVRLRASTDLSFLTNLRSNVRYFLKVLVVIIEKVTYVFQLVMFSNKLSIFSENIYRLVANPEENSSRVTRMKKSGTGLIWS